MKGASVLAPSYPGQDFLDGTEPCTDVDPEVFFPHENGSASEAKKICQRCDVRQECADYAIKTGQKFGVWGGMSAEDRGYVIQRIRMQRHRAKKAQQRQEEAA